MHTCNTPSCAGREIRFEHERWVHTDTGQNLCDPLNDSLKKALPVPPSERRRELPAWFKARLELDTPE